MSQWELFKFRKIDKYLLGMLVQSEIYFARPEQLNDPFDCTVDIPNALNNAISKADTTVPVILQKLRDKKMLLEDIQNRIQTVGVCSFSLELKNTLLWAHYGDNHRGICLMYDFPETFFYKPGILGVAEVDYGESPLCAWFLEEAPSLESAEKFGTSLITKALTIKAKSWRYEKEIRIVREEPGIHCLERHQLKQVCFGMRTPKADVTLVRELLTRFGYNATVCKIVHDGKSDFGLDIVEI